MSKLIKICGLKTSESIKASQGADYVGFIVGSPKSHRNISLELLGKLLEHIESPKSVAVTVNDDRSFLKKLIDLQPDIIQLHGKARQNFRGLDYPIAMAFTKNEFVNYLSNYDYEHDYDNISFVTIDSVNKEDKDYGGTGINWEWEPVPQFVSPVLIAGGIDFDNYQVALEQTKADGIDISSSVERNGIKDPNMIVRLIKAIRRN